MRRSSGGRQESGGGDVVWGLRSRKIPSDTVFGESDRKGGSEAG